MLLGGADISLSAAVVTTRWFGFVGDVQCMVALPHMSEHSKGCNGLRTLYMLF